MPVEDLYPSRNRTEPAILDRQDPIIHSTDFSAAPISEEQLRQYEEKGFLLLPEVFSRAEVSRFLNELNQMQQDQALLDSEVSITEPDSGALRSVFQIHHHNDLFSQVASDPRVADIARFILDDDLYIHQSRLNFKPGFNGREFYWHSDFETWHVEDGMPRMRALSASILLTDNSDFNGSLMVMPGSHRKYVSCAGETPDDYYRHSLQQQTVGTPDNHSLSYLHKQYGLESTAAPAGSVLLFDCNLMHGSNGNITPMPRSNLFFVYNAASNRCVAPFCNQPPRPEFLATRETFDILPQRSASQDRKAG
ncbi:ectoine hydroxylase [Marinobacterium sp. AK62]|uniref:Ectoine hydroxylase n=1 Tax=Marinobacterium alkalitolerans TaxID=1542925 RepID=A0ABS3Z878_9GAMM|nr:ectoine hydroxylase [Marinobacterium alkalitolerans]MBP0047898.1 ectoine hydroxylase [Marinobacterium alkalitolerans]